MTAAVTIVLLGAAVWSFWQSRHSAERAEGADDAAAESTGRPRGPQPLWTTPVVPPRGELTIRGVVRDERGPVSGAMVVATSVEEGETLSALACHCDNDCGLKLLECGCPEASGQMVQLVSERRGEAPPVARTSSGSDGEFELRGLAKGTYALWAQGKAVVGVRQPVEAGASDVAVTLGAGQSIQGKVVGEDKRPIAGAVVTGVYVDHTRFFDAVSGADGSFVIAPLPPGKFAVVAIGSGLLPEHVRASEHHEALTFTLYRPRTLRGRVERSGTAVAGAAVVVEGEHRKRRTTSDRAGSFAIPGLHPGEYTLRATAGLDCAESSFRVTPGLDPELAVVSLEAGGDIIGEVTSSVTGKPVAGAKVTGSSDLEDSSASVTKVSDSRGAYRVGPLPVGRANIVVRAKGFLESDEPVVTITAGGSARRDVRLSPAASIHGRVVDEAGNAVARAKVSARAVGEETLASQATSGQDGGFELEGLPAGKYLVSVDHSKFKPLRREAATAPASGIALVLRRGAVISGDVRSGDGSGMPGVTVWASRVQEDLEEMHGRSDGQSPSETGEEGKFRLEGLEAGEYWIRARTEAGGESGTGGRYTSAKVVVAEGGADVAVRLVFEEGGSISGVVVDGKGAPVAGVALTAFPEMGASVESRRSEREATWRASGSATSGADGRFTIPHLTAVNYRLHPRKDGYGSSRGEESPLAQVGSSEVRVVLQAMGVIRGQVLHRDGTPLTSFFLNGEKRQDAEGRFSFPIRESGTVRLSVWTVELAGVDRTVDVQEGAVVELPPIVLDEGRSIEGRVVDAAGAPVEGALVDVGGGEPPSILEISYFSTHGGGFRTLSTRRGAVRTGAEGSFKLPHVAQQPGYIVVQHPHYMSYARAFDGFDPVTVTLASGARVLGVVQDAAGAVIPGTVRARSESQNAISESQEDGSYVLWGLRPGEYSLEILDSDRRTGGRVFRSKKVTVPASGDVRVDFREVATGTDVLLDVHETSDSPSEGGFVLFPGLVRAPTDLASARSLEGGAKPDYGAARQQTFRRVQPGPYTLIFFRWQGNKVGVFTQAVEVAETPDRQTVRVVIPEQLPTFAVPE